MQKTTMALFVASTLVSVPLLAEDSIELDTIEVQGNSFSQQIGTQKITEKEIKNQATTNGNLTDLLKNNPNVRFDSSAELSSNGGEIAPNEVSFHGEKFYNNNYIVDGMSNNDNMNPGAAAPSKSGAKSPQGTNAHDLPAGGTQSFWIDSRLVKSVEVFDSNVSAKYGNFTGGVVNAELKDPSFERRHSGNIYYRTTRDSWATFHVDDEKSFESATELYLQPKFVKQQYGVNVSERLSEQFSLLFAYNRTESKIKYYHPSLQLRDSNGKLSEKGQFSDNQRRIAETYLLRGVYLPDNGDLWRATFIYSPHQSKYFKRHVLDGAFTSTGGGYQFNLEWEKQLNNLKMKSYIGYKKTGDRVKHQQQDYYRYQAADYLDWVSLSGFAMQGGFGTFKTQKQIMTVKQDYELNEFDLWDMQHNLSFGWQLDFAKAQYIRENESHNYTYKKGNVNCGNADHCIDHSQYAETDQVFFTRNNQAKDNFYSAYIQDNLKWHRLSLSLGLRIDHNQFLGKTNFAHRLSGSYDVFGDQTTQLFAGFNRYYAGSMLAYKLHQNISTSARYRRNLESTTNQLSDWYLRSYAYLNTYNVSRLNNPYSDETVFGISQRFLNADWTLKWVNRYAKDQFMTEQLTYPNSTRTYSGLTNNGWTKNDTVTLSVKPLSPHKYKHIEIDWDLNLSLNGTKTNSNFYSDPDNNDEYEYAIYNNKLYEANNYLIPRDFNNPWKFSSNINLIFPKIHLTWTNRLSYTGGRKYIYNDGEISCNGENTISAYRQACGNYIGRVMSYKDAYQSSHFLLDWRFIYQYPLAKNQSLEFTLDINNVLNKRAVAKSAEGTTAYKMGRNFWLGVSYNW